MISQRIRKALPGAAAVACLALGAGASAEPLEVAIGLDVDNPSVFMTAMERLQESDDVRGARVSLWMPEFGPGDAASHVVVVEYDDYDDYETRSERRLASPDWQTYLGMVSDSSRLVASSLMIERMIEGEGWRNHGAAAVFVMTVSEPAKYAQALEQLVSGQGHPGSIRLMEVRAGGEGATHVVIVTAPGFVALNEYFDELFASEDFRRFADQVRSSRTIYSVNQYRRIKSWGD